MRGQAGPWLIDRVVDLVRASDAWAGLLTAMPPLGDPTSAEAGGAGYVRKKVTWDDLDMHSLANAEPLTWQNLPTFTLVAVGLFTSNVGANLILLCPLSSPKAIRAGGAWTAAAHELYFEAR